MRDYHGTWTIQYLLITDWHAVDLSIKLTKFTNVDINKHQIMDIHLINPIFQNKRL